MSRLFSTRHMIIAAFLIVIAITALAIFAQTSAHKDNADQIAIHSSDWYRTDPGTLSGSRFGYSSLTEALHIKVDASIHQLPWYPDEAPGTKENGAACFIIINAPERKWNEAECSALFDFIIRGGEALIITPTARHLSNTELFLKKFSLTPATPSDGAEGYLGTQLKPYSRITLNGSVYSIFKNKLPAESFIRVGSSAKDPVFISNAFSRIYTDHAGNTVLAHMRKKDWKGGQIIWLNGALPGYNGEHGDPTFPEPYLRQILKKKNVDMSRMGEFRQIFDQPVNNIERTRIPDQGDQRKINSAIAFLESILPEQTETKKTSIVFFEYLRKMEDDSELLSLLSSGALYAVIISALFALTGFIFFVRDHPPITALREYRALSLTNDSPVSEIDPPVMRQSITRFKAQYIQLARMLRKIPKEK
jgi:hypothetical protein